MIDMTTKSNKQGGYKSSFHKNITDQTDQPVFTVDEAITKLKDNSVEKKPTETLLDEFY